MNIHDYDEASFRAALDAARLGPRGANPRVGSTLVSASGEVLAVGHHRGAGTPHAEADALMQAQALGLSVEGATCIVTLEPCAHEGRTPSCAQSLIKAGISRVLYAVDDPHAVASGGAAMLRDAGVEVHSWADCVPGGVGIDLALEAESINERWFLAKREARPFVTAKIAQTLDAKVAAANGESQWITSAGARAAGHELRGVVDAIIVGTGTFIADDPSLTARTEDGALVERQPLRVVVGEREVPESAKIRGADARFVHVASRDIRAALEKLYMEHGAEHVLIEGGPTLVTAALRAGVVDDLFVHIAPTLLGAGAVSVGELGIASLRDRMDFDIDEHSVRLIGGDVVLHAAPRASTTVKVPGGAMEEEK